MRANELILHCFAERRDGLWVAACLDFSLAAQATSLGEAKHKLETQIRDYVIEAVTVDKVHGAQLLRRRAPVRDWLKYWFYRQLTRLRARPMHPDACSFREPMPLAPVAC